MIQVQNLNFGYRKAQPILNDVSIRFEKGNIYGILGANGVGKTTLVKLLSGLVFPKSGQVSINGKNPSQRSTNSLKQLFYVPTEVELPKMTVHSYCKLHSVFYSNFNHRTWDNVLENFKVSKDEHTSALSFGQKKKVMLSFALSSGCPILLFDEPTDGLDIPSRDVFRKELSALISDEKLAIITTHHVKDVELLLSHLTILQEYSVLVDASIQVLSQKFRTERLSSILGNGILLYSERVAEGYHCLLKNDEGEEGAFDVELFYKAIEQDASILNSL